MNFPKSLLALSFAALLFASCKQTDSEPKTEASTSVTATEKPATIAKLETTSFSIEGMTCAIGCAKTIEKELSEMEGVQKVTVDFDKKLATVSFDATKQTPEVLVKAVEATGDGKTYKVSNVKSSEDKAMVVIQGQENDSVKKKSCSADEKKSKDGKPACCAKKKHCDKDEKKA
ncbi:heavy-metal-associated domain-containing protein [Flavobacterium psychrotolerans]|uniref:Heavy metal transporter n=1 Tax=Flavobacterium psychrotolerans TaxID=2169410 RepID=A0A2U1JH75_9FLAO|nr:heavy metal-associated domain-containing protein [Flavobacterium psychrotolerans]PWA04510.1 heavy metal transporter [Flavobacterium psychrotolerans]